MIVVVAVGCSSKCLYYFRIIWQLFLYYLAVMTMMGWRRQLPRHARNSAMTGNQEHDGGMQVCVIVVLAIG